MESFTDYGISVDASRGGEVDTTCPECSRGRKKSGLRCLSVNVDEGTWLCHHCGWSGGLKNGKRYAAPVKKQDKKYTRPVYEPEAVGSLLPGNVLQWFASRGIGEEVLDREQIGYSNGWIKFPYYWNGEVVNIKSRKMGDKEFHQEKDAQKVIYGACDIPHDGVELPPLVWVEGEIDRLSLLEAGLQYVVSVPDGAPTPGSKNLQTKFDYLQTCESFVNKFSEHIIAVDNDAPGAALESELARRLGIERCLRVTWPEGCKDANDVLVKHGPQYLSDAVKEARYFPVEGIYEVKDIIGDAARLYDEGVTRGVSTGWPSLDKFITIRPSEFGIITGRPSSGKSSLIDHMMINLAEKHDFVCGVYSPENAPLAQHFKKLAECYIGKPFLPGQTERMTPTEVIDAGRFLNQHFFFISSNDTMLTTSQILEKAKVLVYRHGINFLVIDPYNDICQSDLHGETETERVKTMTSKMQRFARMHKVFVMLVAHPTKLRRDERTGEYPVATLGDIAGSANFFNRCDVGLSCHRPDVTKDFIELHVQKVRFREIGTPGMVRLDYSRSCGRFYEHVGTYTGRGWQTHKRQAAKATSAELAAAAAAFKAREEDDGE